MANELMLNLAQAGQPVPRPHAPSAARVGPGTLALDEMWQQVFEQARVVPAEAARPGLPVDAEAPQSWLAAPVASGPALPEPRRLQAAALPRDDLPAAAARGASVAPQAPAAAAGRGPAAAFMALRPPGAAPRVYAQAEAAIETAPAAAPPGLAAYQLQAASDESVQVLQGEHGIEIIVRNARLASQAALGCAFETAYSLTGSRASLRKLILNGATVFEAGTAATATLPQRRQLVFSC